MQLTRLKHSMKPTLAFLTALLLAPLAALCANDLRDRYEWRQVRIGGGGFVTGVLVKPPSDQ